MELRSYQRRAVDALKQSKRGVVQSPAGSGKTIIGAAAIDSLLDRSFDFRPKITWLANTTEQVEQAKKAVSSFPRILEKCELQFACYAAGLNCSSSHLVIADECHHIAAPQIRKSLDGCTGRIWGLSATPTRADELAEDVFKLIGPIVCVIGREELLSAGCLAAAVVQFHAPNSYRELEQEIITEASPLIARRLRFWRNVSADEVKRRTLWQCCQQIGIIDNAKRNASVVSLAKQHVEDSTLLLVGAIEHGEYFKTQINGAVLAHAKMGAKRRREAMERFKSRELRCLIATSLADEGLDLPCANVLILAAGGRSAAKAEQRTGRVLRTFQGKTHGIVHDFKDHQFGMLQAQSAARRRVYLELGYTVKEAA